MKPADGGVEGRADGSVGSGNGGSAATDGSRLVPSPAGSVKGCMAPSRARKETSLGGEPANAAALPDGVGPNAMACSDCDRDAGSARRVVGDSLSNGCTARPTGGVGDWR